LNVLHLFYSLGSFIGPILSGLVISWYGNWRLSFSIMAILFCPLIGISILAAHKSHGVRPRMAEPGKGVGMVELIKRGRTLVLAGFFYLGAETGTTAWLPTFLVLVRGFSIGLAGVALGLFWGAMAVGRLVLGSVTDRVRFRRMILLSSLLSAVLIFLGIVVGNEFWIIISWSLSGFVMAPIMPTVFAWTNRLFDSRTGFVTGVIYGVGFGGGVFSPWLLGSLADLLSLRLAMLYLVFSISAIGVSILIANDSALFRNNES
jgi:FHS family glucose/mannose:H+ symporter-like MFS transporter